MVHGSDADDNLSVAWLPPSSTLDSDNLVRPDSGQPYQ